MSCCTRPVQYRSSPQKKHARSCRLYGPHAARWATDPTDQRSVFPAWQIWIMWEPVIRARCVTVLIYSSTPQRPLMKLGPKLFGSTFAKKHEIMYRYLHWLYRRVGRNLPQESHVFILNLKVGQDTICRKKAMYLYCNQSSSGHNLPHMKKLRLAWTKYSKQSMSCTVAMHT